jgi:glucose-6-phosphate 1-dehydrogenase
MGYNEVTMPKPSTILVIFGISGDLAQRKLLPGLQKLADEGQLGNAHILGISRQSIDSAELLNGVLGEKSALLKNMFEVVTMDVAELEDYRSLRQKIESIGSTDSQVVFYLSVPPAATLPIVERLGASGLNDSRTKLLLEKPFGVDLSSAEEAITKVAEFFDESQVYRIDHYLAKEMAQNIIAFRSHNAIFRNLWHADFIEKIDIVASERIGIEGRANFYEQTGALRDFVQNHLMQLAALTLMDIPAGFEMKELPARRQKALEEIIHVQTYDMNAQVVRGQYDGYQQEANNPGSTTETFVGLKLYSRDERWRGVPISLATGKNLARQATEIRIHFKKTHAAESNLLVLHIQPKEGIEIDLWAKKPGYEKDYEKMSLQFDYKQPAGKPVEAYERVLLDAISSDKSLFTCAEEVLASWRILQPIQEKWAYNSDDLRIYKPGTAIEDLMV